MMKSKYKYELQKGSKHIICPACKKKTFKPYVNAENGQIVDASIYGRCERINRCKYLKYPENDASMSDWIAPVYVPEPIQPDFIPKKMIEASFSKFRENTFFMWLVKLFGQDIALDLQSKYNIGTAKNNGTIFFQQDSEGKFRTGKVMYYNADGKRNKNRNSWYVHNEVKEDFELVQVFFGEHLIKENPDKPVALVESEKTAILMSVFEPEYTWLASGGANMLNSYRLLRLPRLDLVSADEGEFENWSDKTKSFFNRQMDGRVEKAFREGKVSKGADILDLILIEKGLNEVKASDRVEKIDRSVKQTLIQTKPLKLQTYGQN
ncbi:MAG TPA: DUF6371 domain-containing protein [Flavobacterium sp.]|nr:DUF6371 domain-containing protein [Flavobacterium sp.]